MYFFLYLCPIKRLKQILNVFHVLICLNQQVGDEFIPGVSGGERKRCSIGMELIISPPVLFLDEPTTRIQVNASLHPLLSKFQTRVETSDDTPNMLLSCIGWPWPLSHSPRCPANGWYSLSLARCQEPSWRRTTARH